MGKIFRADLDINLMDSYITKIREESPTFQKHIYLNHASTGPLHARYETWLNLPEAF